MKIGDNMKIYSYTLNMILLNILSILLFILCFIIVIPIYGDALVITNISLLISLSIIYLILHELIHYLGFIIDKKVDRKKVVLGAELEKGIMYCMCKTKIDKKNILISIFAPLLSISIITLIIGMYFHLDMLIFLSIMNIASSIGDIIMGLFILKLPKDIKYIDLDDTTSFYIISNKDLKKYKFPGIIFKEEKKYDDKICAKDYKKIKISKTSIIIFLVLLIIIIGGLI
jgi:hypothetical protein